MKVLLDENVPHPLTRALSKHHVSTVRDMGWEGIRNGELLRDAEVHGFDALVTCDKNMQYQQRAVGRQIAIISLSTNNWPAMRPYTEMIATAVTAAAPGTFQAVQCGAFRRRRSRKSL